MSDRCAACFEELLPAPLGGRYVCEKHPLAGYLSATKPESPHTRKACVTSRFGRPTLHYYGYLK